MDTNTIIVALAGVVTTLASFIAVQFKMQLADKDKQIADKDKQIERWEGVANSNSDTTKESLAVLKDVQRDIEELARDVLRDPPAKRATRTRE